MITNKKRSRVTVFHFDLKELLLRFHKKCHEPLMARCNEECWSRYARLRTDSRVTCVKFCEATRKSTGETVPWGWWGAGAGGSVFLSFIRIHANHLKQSQNRKVKNQKITFHTCRKGNNLKLPFLLS